MAMKRKMLIPLFLLYAGSFLSLHAQWAKTYGGAGTDEAYAIQQTGDGGYIVAGMTAPFGDEKGDAWLIKIGPAGNIQWQKTYGKNFLDAAYAIMQTHDGGYVVAGALAREGWSIWVLKLDSNGEVEWQKSLKGNVYEYGLAYAVQQTSDGGYIAAGEFRYGELDRDVWLMKLTSDGTKEWDKLYGGNDREYAYDIQQTSDGGYIVSGQNDSSRYAEIGGLWILKLHPSGEIQWQKTYGGEKDDYARSIQQTSDGGYIVAGGTASFGAGSGDDWVMKLDPEGAIEWQKTIGGEGQDFARSIRQTSDGGYIVAGTTYSFGLGDGDIWVLKLDESGNIEWQKTYGGYGKEEAYAIVQSYDGGYAVAGFTESYGAGERDFLVLKLLANGDVAVPCEFEKESFASVQKTDVNPADTDVIPVDTNLDVQDHDINPEESGALVYSICLGQHTLDLSASPGGTTDPQPGAYVYYHASRVNVEADPEDAYVFGYWSGDEESIENPLTITMDADKSVKANFMEEFEEIWEEVKKTPCFIATAAYESPSHPHVCILRSFKDKFLMTHKWGRELVAFYYRYSPSIADFISKYKFLKFPVRHSLQPFVTVSYMILTLGPVQTGILFFVIVLALVLVFSVFRRHGLLFLAVVLIFLSSCIPSPDQQQAKIYTNGLDSLMNRNSEEVSTQITEDWGFACIGIWKGEDPAPDDVLAENKGVTAFTRKEADALFTADGAYKVMHFMKPLRDEKVSIRTISSTGYTRAINVGKTRDVVHRAYIRVVFMDDKLVHFKVWPRVESE
jgi:hypothetical protein